MEENRKLTQDELLEAEGLFNLATMLGKSIQAAVYQFDHPEYNPEVLRWEGTGKEENSAEEMEGPGNDDSKLEPENKIHSNETNIDSQIAQIALLIHDERLRELIGSCALYPMLRIAAEQFSLNPDDPASNLSPVEMKKAAIAWVIVKRVFAVRHPDEAIRILNIPDVVRGNIYNGKPLQDFRPMDSTDEEMIRETCLLFVSDFTNDDVQIEAIIESISQLPQSDMLYLPTAKAFRNQNLIATNPLGGHITVDGRNPPTEIFLQITGEDGQKLEQLSHFEMNLEAAIGQVLQQFRMIPGNENKPLYITSSQLYRAYAGLNSDHPVTPAQREATSQAFKKLIHTPATLDITEQLKKHTSLKEKPEYAYFKKGKVIGNLVTGSITQRFYNGRIIEEVFTIHEIPMLYSYSSMLNQIAAIEKKLLTGEGVTQRQRSNIEDIDLRRYLLVEINRIKRDKDERNNAIRQANKRRSPKEQKRFVAEHTESLNFDTIAKGSGFNISTDKLARTLREKVYDFMQEQAAAGNIKRADYKIINRRYTGIIIVV